MEKNFSENLDSTSYRCLFEYIKEYGIESALKFFQDIHSNTIPKRDQLINRVVMGYRNDVLVFLENNKNIIKYIREHFNEFCAFDLCKEQIENVIIKISDNPSLLNTYLENARILEDLKVSYIKLVDSLEPTGNPDPVYDNPTYICEIYRKQDDNKIMRIVKYYTDGIITPKYEKFERGTDLKYFDGTKWHKYIVDYNIIRFVISKDATFLLKCDNDQRMHQFRAIYIKDFGFDAKKLPDESELETYDIPKELLLKKRL